MAWGITDSGTIFGEAVTLPNNHFAGYWTGGASSFVNLAPTGYTQSEVFGSDGTSFAGLGVNNSHPHALLWSATPGNPVDLNPSGFQNSGANGTSGGYQSGYAYNGNPATVTHAMLWNGTAASAVDLNPAGYSSSAAEGILNGVETGEAVASDGNEHGGIWAGTPTFVDMNPPGFASSLIRKQGWFQFAGSGYTQLDSQDEHALLWNGDSPNAIDLNPSGFISSQAIDTNGIEQVGDAWTTSGGTPHPMVWHGSAASAIDLTSFLPAGYTEDGINGVNAQGVIVGQAFVFDPNVGGEFRAYELIPTPEPGVLACLTLIPFITLLRIRPAAARRWCAQRNHGEPLRPQAIAAAGTFSDSPC